MATIPVTWTVGEFTAGVEDWESFVERVEFFFQANGVEDPERKGALLLSSCVTSTYKLIRNLLVPSKPASVTYKDIVDRVRAHYQPASSTPVERLKFHSRIRKPTETVSTFICQLRELSQRCAFENLDEMLKDRLICGIGDSRMQRRLLSESSLTFTKAQDILLALEAADNNAGVLEASGTTHPKSDVYHSTVKKAVSTARPGTRSFPSRSTTAAAQACYRCGGNHSQQGCKIREAICHFCQKKGHISRVCRSKLRKRGSPTTNTQNYLSGVDHVNSNGSKEAEYTLFQLHSASSNHSSSNRSSSNRSPSNRPSLSSLSNRSPSNPSSSNRSPSNRPWLVPVDLNGTSIEMQIDTGATMSIMSRSVYSSLWKVSPPLERCDMTLKTYSGEQLPVIGKTYVLARYKGQSEQLLLLIVENSGPTLLGRDWLQHLRLDWSEVNLLATSSRQLVGILEEHSKLFQQGLGTFTGALSRYSALARCSTQFF